jgi:single-strand DNA-binding protein
MANYNRIVLVGNLTRDPQLSYLPNQTAVVEIGMAINHKWKDAQGNAKEDVCFVDCRCYGRQAETLNQYVKKGQQILVEGRLQYSTWEGKDGVKRSKHRVMIDRFQFLGAPSGQGRGPAPARAPQAGAAPGAQSQYPAQSQMPPPAAEAPPEPPPYEDEPPPTGEDIPF